MPWPAHSLLISPRRRNGYKSPRRLIRYPLGIWNESAANAMQFLPKRRRPTGVRHAAAHWLSGRACQNPTPEGYRQKWIIAALCCPAGTRWAESLRRSELTRSLGAIRDGYRGQRLQPTLPGAHRRSRTCQLSAPARKRHGASRGSAHRLKARSVPRARRFA